MLVSIWLWTIFLQFPAKPGKEEENLQNPTPKEDTLNGIHHLSHQNCATKPHLSTIDCDSSYTKSKEKFELDQNNEAWASVSEAYLITKSTNHGPASAPLYSCTTQLIFPLIAIRPYTFTPLVLQWGIISILALHIFIVLIFDSFPSTFNVILIFIFE